MTLAHSFSLALLASIALTPAVLSDDRSMAPAPAAFAANAEPWSVAQDGDGDDASCIRRPVSYDREALLSEAEVDFSRDDLLTAAF